jgi:hypothetical protein
MRPSAKTWLIIGLATVAFGDNVHAQTLPSATVTAQIQYTGPDLTSTGGARPCAVLGFVINCSATSGDLGVAGGSGFGSVTSGPYDGPFIEPASSNVVDPNIAADAAGSNQSGSAIGELIWYVSIEPNHLDGNIPPYLNSLFVVGDLEYTPYSNDGLGNAAYGTAVFTISNVTTGSHLYQQTAEGVFIRTLLTADVGLIYEVDMVVDAVFGANPGSSEDAQSKIDPTFSLSPEDALNYHLVFSSTPDAPPVNSVPQPSSLAMLAAGLVSLLGFGALRRCTGKA